MLFLEIAAGLTLLVIGGELLVRGAVAFAVRLKVSPLLIGLTVVGFGTSMPELATCLEAAFIGAPGIAVGNVIGSNIANILLILGVAAVLTPIPVAPRAFLRDGTVAVIAALACLGVILAGSLERISGLILIALLAGYIVYAARDERVVAEAETEDDDADGTPAQAAWLSALLVIGGIAAMVLGAKFLVDGAVQLAALAGVSDTVIGLTVVAVGTSLPELVTAAVAAYRRAPDIAFGNVVGSNIYNILGILGTTAVIHPIPIPAEIIQFDIWVMLAATAALAFAAVTGWRVTRMEGVGLLAAYGIYVGVLATG